MDSIHDIMTNTRISNPFESPMKSNDSPSESNGFDLIGMKKMRDKYFEDLMATYKTERWMLRDKVDAVHMKLQDIRVRCFMLV